MTLVQGWIKRRQRLVRLVAVLSLLLGSTVVSIAAAAPRAYATSDATPVYTETMDTHSVNICSNDGDGGLDGGYTTCGGQTHVGGESGAWWQCVEFAQRFYEDEGWYSGIFPLGGNLGAARIYAVAVSGMGMSTQPNGSITSIVPGDMIVHGTTDKYSPDYGHVAIVASVSGSTVDAVQQNAPWSTTYTLSSGTLSGGSGTDILGIVHSSSNTNTDSGGGSGTTPDETVPGNWVGNGTTDYAVFRPGSSPPSWHYDCNGSGGSDCAEQPFGVAGDIPAPGYYFGSKQLDWAVYRPSDETWYILNQATKDPMTIPFGVAGDIPVPGDYQGNGTTQPAIFRPSDDTWHIYEEGADVSISFGSSGDIPVPAFWDGGSKMEPGIYRPSTGEWIYHTPTGDVTKYFGLSGDIPVPGYYSGSSKPDYAVFRPSNSTWYVSTQSGSNWTPVSFGTTGDIPVPGMYTGGTTTQFAVFRPSNDTWHYDCGGGDCSMGWGLSGDIPAVSTLPYPLLVSLGLCDGDVDLDC